MIRLVLHIRWGSRKRASLLLTSLVCVLIAAAALLAFDRVEGTQPIAPTDFVPSQPGRHVYLTNFDRTPDQALTACSEGYHMASIWELADISNLIYDYKHPDAYTKADSGKGPPSYWYGWVRTGYDITGANTAGTGNCLNWTSTLRTNYGTIARLTNTWDTPTGALSPWEADTWYCGGIAPVWCVGDWEQVKLPLVVK